MTNDDWEAEIDGSTLEKRREQRAEKLERFVGNLNEEDRRGFVGKVNQWTRATGVNVVPASQSVYDLNKKQKQLRNFSDSMQFDAPPVIKRTPEQRLDSMVVRLKAASPETVEPILAEIAGEYWKMGMPVRAEDLRTVAAHFLNKTERKK